MKKLDYRSIARPCVSGFVPYVPGKPISEVRRKYRLKKIIKLASNENPLGPSSLIYPALTRAMPDLYLYPVGTCAELRTALARKLRVSVSEVIIGSGSDEIIELLGKAFLNPSDEIVVSRHAFIRYKMAGQLMGCAVREVPMKHFTHNLDAMHAAITSKTKIVFIANPNNPTGTYVRERDLRSFLKKVPARVIVCLDEAYYEYALLQPDYPDGIRLYREGFSNVISLRTFSKIYALAGLRVGYGIADPSLIDCLDRLRPPFNVNTMAQIAAAASIRDKRQVVRGQAMVRTQLQRTCRFLDSRGIRYVPSAANFVLIDAGSCGYTGRQLFEILMKRGIIVREMSEYELPQWVRITLSTAADMNYLFSELKRIQR